MPKHSDDLTMRYGATAAGCHLLAALLIFFLLPVSGAFAQDPAGTTTVADAEVLKRKIEEVQATNSLDKAIAAKLVDFYRKALAELEQARTHQADADGYIQVASGVPAEIIHLERLFEQRGKITVAGPRVPPQTPLLEINESLIKEKADLAAVEARLADISNRYALAIERPAIARKRLLEAKLERDVAVADIAASAPDGEPAAVTQARLWFLDARARALSAEILKLDTELQSQRARLDLLEAQRAEVASSVAIANGRVRAFEQILGERRREEANQAQQKAAAARAQFAHNHPAVRELARQNAALSDVLAEMAIEFETVAIADQRAHQEAARIEKASSSMANKLAIAGLSQALGHVLLEQQRSLPALAPMLKDAKARQRQIANTALRLVQWDEERSALQDHDSYVAGQMVAMTRTEAEEFRPALNELAASRRDLVRTAVDSGAAYLQALNDLDLVEVRLMSAVEAYDEFLVRRLLWMRSFVHFKVDVVRSVPGDLKRLVSPSNWVVFLRDFQTGVTQLRFDGAVLALLVLLALARSRFHAALAATSEKVWQVREDRIGNTLKALAFTALATAPLPLLLFAVGWVTTLGPEPATLSTAIAEATMTAGRNFFLLGLFLGICRADGVAARHFRWPAEVVNKLRRELGWLFVILPTTRFIALTSSALDTTAAPGGFTIIAAMAAGGAFGWFVFRLFTPAGGVLRVFLAERPDSLFTRFRVVWVAALTMIMPTLIILWLSGYTYTGTTVAVYFMNSVALVGGLVVLYALAGRALMIVTRRLQYQATIERVRAARAAAKNADGDDSASGEGAVEIAEPAVDFAALDSDSRKLLRIVALLAGGVGFWMIWSGTIPALSILDEISIWSYSTIVDGIETQVPITAASLALTIIVVIATFATARGLPSIIAFILLQHTSVTVGGRYTAVTLLRYAIFTVGGVIVFGMLGGSWSEIQWLVAALGVGIGFGLQEIVANFISGLIILFERPIRIGDTVTVGDFSGVVSRIQIRATTITDWDRKELIVPNKEFVTGRLLNWTLSDTITRVSIPVGIAYGSDVAKAMMLAQEAADEHDNVTENPRPFVTLEGFGDNALELLVRAYIPSLDNRLRTASDLREAIVRKFSEANIVVAFPQRDIHLDTRGPLDIRLHRGGGKDA